MRPTARKIQIKPRDNADAAIYISEQNKDIALTFELAYNIGISDSFPNAVPILSSNLFAALTADADFVQLHHTHQRFLQYCGQELRPCPIPSNNVKPRRNEVESQL